ncbi:hypothetical protein NUW58_g10326 [Xylaria curta]|uniref:Uncharacterized protein n=1 Tax=Xylaria curta TaxID=42375 RepID=A0ACC1MMS2_9PEZI|nr:hypothetical protein NUW58_g10326 [Xylaria curta]
MAAGDCDTPARAVGSSASAPTAIRRTTSSPPGLQGPSLLSFAQGAASSGVSVTRVRSTQERINEILEVGGQRADSLSLHIRSPRRASIMSVGRMPPSSGHVGEPDERTSFAVAGNTMNYQSTQTTSNLRSRQPPPTSAMDPASQHGGTTQGTEEKKHWVWDSLDGFWSFELENKGSVARDHLAVGMFYVASYSLACMYPGNHGANTEAVRRTHISCLAANIPRIYLDRDSDHPTIPSQHAPR